MTLIALMMLAADPSAAGSTHEVLLLDFTASYCQPCQQMVPTIQGMQKDGYPIRKIDTTREPEVASRYNVKRIPTFILLVNGKETQRLQGIRSRDELQRIMLDAQSGLDEQKAAQRAAEDQRLAEQQRAEERKAAASTKPAEKSPGGFRGLLARLTGQSSRNGFQHPEFRGQSPDSDGDATLDAATDDVIAATVRVRVDGHGNRNDVGTGSIVHSSAGESIVLTCAHLFRDMESDATVEVDVFQNDSVFKYQADVIRGDHNSDLAILKIQNKEPLPSVQLASVEHDVAEGSAVFSIGCDHGKTPTPLSMNVVRLNPFNNIPSHLVCSFDPAAGRSGGGLFNDSGQLIGVCSCADRKLHEGLYMGLKPIFDQFTKAKLVHLLIPPEDTEESPVFMTAEADPSEFRNDELIESLFGEEQEAAIEDVDFDDVFEVPGAVAMVDERNADVMTAALDDQSNAPVMPEVTVIVEAKDGSGRKEMIVIKKPTPYLIELLTGRSPTESQQAVAATKVQLTPTGVRRTFNAARNTYRRIPRAQSAVHVGHHSD